jgi:hypothetical protein
VLGRWLAGRPEVALPWIEQRRLRAGGRHDRRHRRHTRHCPAAGHTRHPVTTTLLLTFTVSWALLIVLTRGQLGRHRRQPVLTGRRATH